MLPGVGSGATGAALELLRLAAEIHREDPAGGSGPCASMSADPQSRVLSFGEFRLDCRSGGSGRVRRSCSSTLPCDEILERIRPLTNLRVDAGESADTGYRMEIGRFPGWRMLPRW